MTVAPPNSHTPQCAETDVLVIGAGPSGLFIAQALIRLGIKVKVVERRYPGTLYGNADGLQPRTLEILQSYGLLEILRPKAAYMHAIVAYEKTEDGEGLRRMQPGYNITVPTRYPYEITASIKDIEGTLEYSYQKEGGEVVRPAQPISLKYVEVANNEGYIEAEIQDLLPLKQITPRDTVNEIIRAKYVIGADGAHSWVRNWLNIPMEGEDAECTWGVIDILCETNFPDHRVKAVIQARSGAIIVIPREEDKIRIYVQLSDIMFPRKHGRIDKCALSTKDMQNLILMRIKEGLRPYTLNVLHIFWSTIFSEPQKVATTFSWKNRIFIVGDACHTHSPKAGQGANISMGDSHNLAWKLAYVLRGWSSHDLLHTYSLERRKLAMDLIEFDKVVSKNLENETADSYKELLRQQNLFTSGIGIRYLPSPLTFCLTSTPGRLSKVQCGERLPFGSLRRVADWYPFDLQDLCPSDGLFKLLVFPGDIKRQQVYKNLNDFAMKFESINTNQYRSKFYPERLAIHTILRTNKACVSWTDVPPVLMQSWRCCFVSEVRCLEDTEVYDLFGIDDSKDAIVLVRPDGYISTILDMGENGAQQVFEFLSKL